MIDVYDSIKEILKSSATGLQTSADSSHVFLYLGGDQWFATLTGHSAALIKPLNNFLKGYLIRNDVLVGFLKVDDKAAPNIK